MPGFYYCSWDNHNRFGSRTPSDEGAAWGNWAGVPGEGQPMAAFTTSVCDPIGKEWFHVEGDAPRSDEKLLEMLRLCRERGTNLLLDVPPDRHGRIPEASVQALLRLRRNAGL